MLIKLSCVHMFPGTT